jgi:hypothetical protein
MRDHSSFGAVPLYSGIVDEEETKGENQALDVTFAVSNIINENEMTASKRQYYEQQEISSNPRRSKRLESRHNNLIQM